MKRLVTLCLLMASAVIFTANAKNKELKTIVDNGNKANLEVVDISGDINGDIAYFHKIVKKEKFNRLIFVENKKDADLTCRMTLERIGSGLTFAPRIKAYIEIITPDGKVVWKSKDHKGEATEFTGFNAYNDAIRRIVRRALEKEFIKQVGK